MVRVSKSERDRAERLANSAAGAALEQDVQKEKTFVPGQGQSAEESFATSFTPEQKEQIRQMVANAKSPAEIEEIELSVQRGVFPGVPPTVTPPVENEDRKRPAEEEPEDEASAKRSRAAES